MQREPLPIPGVVLGRYPERVLSRATLDALNSPSKLIGDFLRAALDKHSLIERLQQAKLTAKLARVRAFQNAVVGFPGRAFRDSLNQTRAELARDGLSSDAALRCIAHVLVAIRATSGHHLRDAQILAALAVLDQRLAELPTGEGKTLATALAAATAALAGVPVHAVTANDYLAQRDAQLLAPMYRLLGLSVGAVHHALKRHERTDAYANDVVYCSAKELVFDYLRDTVERANDGNGSGQMHVLRGLCMAIIDEADSVLIDDAGTPFVLSEARAEPQQAALCNIALAIAREMQDDIHYRQRSAHQAPELTPDGCMFLTLRSHASDAPLWAIPRYREAMVELALHALHGLRRDVDYLVKNDKVMLVDANTGRAQEGRAWSRGLHQLVEIKEGCPLTQPNHVVAQITFQRFFTRYLHLGGLSGTLTESRRELLQTYSAHVLRIPTRHPSLRIEPPLVFLRAEDRWRWVIEEVARRHQVGQAVLVGTDSIAESERLSRLLADRGLPHRVLNARQDHDEAHLIGQAGQLGAITVATNMAGRGADIPVSDQVIGLGGLHVLSCQHNSARRIDRQLFGRAARQAQPGSAQTILSLQEGLLARYVPTIWRRALAFASRADSKLPIWIARALIRFTQAREEQRLRGARGRLRQRDAHQLQRSHFGLPAE